MTEGKDWVDILDILMYVYRLEQIDPDHERNRGVIGFKADWKTHTTSE